MVVRNHASILVMTRLIGGFEELIGRERANVLPHDFGPVHLFLIVVVCVNR